MELEIKIPHSYGETNKYRNVLANTTTASGKCL